LKLEELTVDLLKKVVEIYNRKAYPASSGKKKVVDLPPDASLEEILDFFEEKPSGKGEGLRRYAVALGNINYPRMKLVFQEHLFPGEFCFVVDTHDDMEMPPNAPDIEAWLALKQTNRRLKLEIEEAWEEAGIPTQRMLLELAGQVESKRPSRGKSILVADDEEDLAQATVEMLKKHGYDAWAVFDGEAALEQVREKKPDLLVIDNEMPKLSGMKVIEALGKDPETRALPVLLMTGGPISLSEKKRASGFLCKPFSEKLLVSVVHHLLGEEREEREPAGDEKGGGLAPEERGS